MNINHLILKFIVVLLVVAFCVLSYFTYYSLKQDYSWSEMDWDQNGSTSISEFYESIDVGKENIIVKTYPCNRYFRLKDGMTIKVICHDRNIRISKVLVNAYNEHYTKFILYKDGVVIGEID